MYSFQKEFILIPHSPLIHFQYNSSGAALRATEVKPKLDRYLISHRGGEIPLEWRNEKSKDALNYQLRIISLENNPPIELGRGTNYDIFYGNMGDGPKKKGIKNKQKLVVTCLIKELLDYIEKVIGDFFIVTNFGTMQSKGFGSFTVDGKDSTPDHICDVLKMEYTNLKNLKHCYVFSRGNNYQNSVRDTTFKRIKTFYSLMKSGLNYTRNGQYPERYRRSILFDYAKVMTVKGKPAGMGNEKAWMKQRRISPALNRSGRYVSPRTPDSYSRYVRALLGISEAIRYQDDPTGFVNVKIKEVSDNIERLNSPILFKIIGENVYFIATEVHPEIYGKTFSFSSRMGKGTISVPAKAELPVNFLEEFLHYAYPLLNGCSSKFQDINGVAIREV